MLKIRASKTCSRRNESTYEKEKSSIPIPRRSLGEMPRESALFYQGGRPDRATTPSSRQKRRTAAGSSIDCHQSGGRIKFSEHVESGIQKGRRKKTRKKNIPKQMA